MRCIPGITLLAAALLLNVTITGRASAQIYMNYGDGPVLGDVTAQDHEGWIELTSVQWPTGAEPRSGGRGMAIIRKRTDGATSKLMQACTSGETWRQVVFSVPGRRPAGADRRRIVLTNVRPAGCRAASGETPIESMTLSFEKIELER